MTWPKFDTCKCPFISNGRWHIYLNSSDLVKVWLTCALAFSLGMRSNCNQTQILIHFDWESDHTHTFLNFHCFHIVLAMNFIQTLNGSKDFDLQILYLHVFYIFYHYWDIRVLVLKGFFLLLLRVYNGCVLQNVLQARVSHMTTRVTQGWDENSQARKNLLTDPTTNTTNISG